MSITAPDMAASAPEIILAAIAGATSRIKLSSAVTVLSSADPVRVFQNFVTLDLVSSGRAELMAGRGSFTESFPLFGYSLGDYDALFAEKLELLMALNADGAGHLVGPVPPAAGGRRGAIRGPRVVRCRSGSRSAARPTRSSGPARSGCRMALAIIGGQPSAFVPLADLYRRALEYGGHDPATPLAVHSHGYVFTDEAAARAEFLPAYRATFAKIGRERGWPPMSDAAVEALIEPQRRAVLRRPETVADKIVALQEQMRIDRFELHVSHVDHARTMRSIELFGTEVAPLVRERLARLTC